MKKIYPFLISIFIIFVGILAYLQEISFLDLMELKTIDLRFEARGQIPPSPDVVLAVIDEKSVSKEGKWVWPRSKIANLVTKLSKAGARVIAFDIGFLEPDDKKIVTTINEIQRTIHNHDIRKKEIDNYLRNLKKHANNDQLLADAIKNSAARIVLGYFFHMDSIESGHISENEINIHQDNISGSKYKFIRYASGTAQNIALIEARTPQSNIEIISTATDYCGFFNMLPDKDGVVRWMPGAIKCKETLYAPLSLIAVSAWLEDPISISISEYGVERLQIGNVMVPTDELGRILINYRGQGKTFPHIPVTDILNNNIAETVVKDKIVIVGATAVGIYDLRVTPFGTVFPGVEIHANVVDSILSKDFMYQPAWAAIFDIIAIIAAGLILGLVLPKTGGISGAAASFSLFIGYMLLCQHLFSQKGLILNLVYPLTVIIVIYTSITAYKYFTESRQKRFIKNAFSTYLAPTVVKQLIESPEKLVLGGEQRVITAFFSDIQGFTSISEKLMPHELVELLNEFLTEMTSIILKYEGTVDKFEGDAIIAFFGAPNELENQEEIACMACIDMQKRLSELREGWKISGKPELHMRIGLCTGAAVVGNMGSKTRMDYTMMGDTVNIAARLEGVNKIYGIYTLISETTYSEAGNNIMAREIDSINVVGKKEPVTIYQLLGYLKDADERTNMTIDNYSNGLDAYRNQDWEKAGSFFKAALKLIPDDGPSKVMLVRCDEYKIDPPPKDWDGSFTMKTK
ncbi:MAG: adenylate/guanylate cyclase domain-containing protein [Thermodesulfobacteriota bacterium]|nr:adenylate/guanylate cyclase domain-containing protein [Thermodesulfobacteriota bacterium]